MQNASKLRTSLFHRNFIAFSSCSLYFWEQGEVWTAGWMVKLKKSAFSIGSLGSSSFVHKCVAMLKPHQYSLSFCEESWFWITFVLLFGSLLNDKGSKLFVQLKRHVWYYHNYDPTLMQHIFRIFKRNNFRPCFVVDIAGNEPPYSILLLFFIGWFDSFFCCQPSNVPLLFRRQSNARNCQRREHIY